MLRVIVAATAILAAVTASAQVVVGNLSHGGNTVIYDSGAVVSGAEVNTGVLDVSSCDAISVFTNSDTATRVLTYTPYKEDGTTALIPGGSTLASIVGPAVNYQNLGFGSGGGVTAYTGSVLPPRVKFVLAAGGTNARIWILCKKHL